METEVNRIELIEEIKENHAKHVVIVKEAQEGYKKEVIAELEKMLAAAREGKQVSHHISLVMPVSHMEDYRRIIRMLEMSDEDTITIDDHNFGRYVLDQWEWKRNFLNTNRSYSMSARSENDLLPGADGL